MKFPRRQFLQLAASVVALPVVSRVAGAQTYPSRPVRLIVCYPAGGANDIIGRLIGQWLSERLGQPFIVENRPGAGDGCDIADEIVVEFLIDRRVDGIERTGAGRRHVELARIGFGIGNELGNSFDRK